MGEGEEHQHNTRVHWRVTSLEALGNLVHLPSFRFPSVDMAAIAGPCTHAHKRCPPGLPPSPVLPRYDLWRTSGITGCHTRRQERHS